MIQRRDDFSLLDIFFNDIENKVMKTDIRENDQTYSMFIDLPGYNKEDIKIEIKNGYLSISTIKNIANEEIQNGKFLRRERYKGESYRNFYIGNNIQIEDVKASLKNGVLELTIPKKEKEEELYSKKYVQIDD